MTGVVPYKALGNFSKALYGTTGGTCSARFFRPVMRMQYTAQMLLQDELKVNIFGFHEAL